MKNYYLCDIVGNDNEGYRPAVEDLGFGWSGPMPTGADGRPLFTWTIVVVAAADHSALRSAPGVDPLPVFPLDGKVEGINAATKGLMKAALNRRGLDADALVNGKDGYRDVIRGVGRHLLATFDENNFDVSDV